MISDDFQAIENRDKSEMDAPYKMSVDDAACLDVEDQEKETCVLCTEDKEHKKNNVISHTTLQLKELQSSFNDQDYAEKIEEFLKMVRKIARPGCSPETLNMVLSSMSSLVDTLSSMSSKQYMRSSL